MEGVPKRVGIVLEGPKPSPHHLVADLDVFPQHPRAVSRGQGEIWLPLFRRSRHRREAVAAPRVPRPGALDRHSATSGCNHARNPGSRTEESPASAGLSRRALVMRYGDAFVPLAQMPKSEQVIELL